MATIVDVARRAGVSTSTVSHVINDTRYVSQEIRQKVHAAIDELGYQPNVVARSLRTRKSRIIGVVVPDITNPFFTASVRAIEEEASKHEYSMILCDTGEQVQQEQKYLNLLISRQVDGIIVAPSAQSAPVIASIFEGGTPVVLLDRELPGMSLDLVECDNESGAFDAVSYLIERGHSRICIIAGRVAVSTGAQRLAGYKRAMQEHDLKVDDELIKVGDYRLDLAYQKTREALDTPNRPTAMFVCNNQMTLGAVMAIRDAGLRIPDDISLIGFDDPEWARLMDPPITSVAQPISQMGTKAAEILMARLNGSIKSGPSTATLPLYFTERASCRTLNKSLSRRAL